MMEGLASAARLVFPLLYGACFVLLLWQAFRVMARGFSAASAPPGSRANSDGELAGDRTGRLTIHPELLDADGQLTREDLLTVRFSGDSEPPRVPGEPTE
jgi:hypothetical protein